MKKVSIIGSGNVASHLAMAFLNAGNCILEIHSKTMEHAQQLALTVNAKSVTSISNLDVNTPDMIIIAVSDDQIQSVSDSIPSSHSLVVHTSGTRSMEILDGHSNRGVFYPLQTFSKSQAINFREVPICVESNKESSLKDLQELAKSLSDDVRETNAELRKKIHVAAVIACNFSNHMYALAAKLLEQSGEDLSILKPLILETVNKAFQMPPKEAQTGPAIREDMLILEEHIKRLESNSTLQSLYTEISNSIISLKNE